MGAFFTPSANASCIPRLIWKRLFMSPCSVVARTLPVCHAIAFRRTWGATPLCWIRTPRTTASTTVLIGPVIWPSCAARAAISGETGPGPSVGTVVSMTPFPLGLSSIGLLPVEAKLDLAALDLEGRRSVPDAPGREDAEAVAVVDRLRVVDQPDLSRLVVRVDQVDDADRLPVEEDRGRADGLPAVPTVADSHQNPSALPSAIATP